ncbi:MAG TPA: hypothetical protein VM871_07570, partial [Flavisolibacter sp.]|nr:hypothetical protein [Flavisolibacter sp.]
MSLAVTIKEAAVRAIKDLYAVDLAPADLSVGQTKPEFEGDYTLVLFTLVKTLRKTPEALGNEMGEQLVAVNGQLFTSFNVIKGFLNLTV